MAADAKEEQEESPKQEIVFHLEILGASGLPKPEQTLVAFSGFGIEGRRTSLPIEEQSAEPSGWLFPAKEAPEPPPVEEVDTKKAKKGGKSAAAAPPADAEPQPDPEPVCRVAKPCSTHQEKQQVLDSVCTPLQLAIKRRRDPAAAAASAPLTLGAASVELKELIHDTGSVEVDVELIWSEELLAEMKHQFDAKVAADAEAAAAAAAAAAEERSAEAKEAGEGEAEAAEGADDADGESEVLVPPPPRFEAPAPGKVRLRVSTAGPIGRALCPEDLHDWAVVTVQVDGCFGLPEKLREAGGPLPEGAPGVVEGHPLSYSMRLLDCKFDKGQLVMPEVPPPPEAAAAEGAAADAGAEAEGAAVGEAGEEGEEGDQEEPTPEIPIDICEEEFVEGLMHAGFVSAKEDGPAVFEFLSRPSTGMGGKIGRQEFMRLEELPDLATPAQLAGLRTFLLSQGAAKFEAAAAAAADGGAEGGADGGATEEGAAESTSHNPSAVMAAGFATLFEDEATAADRLSAEAFHAGLERLGFGGLDAAAALFEALDGQGAGELGAEELGVLGLFGQLQVFEAAEKLKDWLLGACGGVAGLAKQADTARSGSTSLEAWKECVQRLGYAAGGSPGGAEAELLFRALAASGAGGTRALSAASLEALPRLEVRTLTKELERFARFLLAEGSVEDPEAAFARLRSDSEGDALAPMDFKQACERLEYRFSVPPQFLFALLDADGAGWIGLDSISALSAYQALQQRSKLSLCKTFVSRAFGGAAAAFRQLFDDRSEAIAAVEETQPRIQWPESTARGYRGRAWLQRLLNTLRDERGRISLSQDDIANGGAWLYFFPCLAGQGSAVDHKELTDATQATLARSARWHHARAFVDLRRLAATDGAGPKVEFRAYLLQVPEQPKDCNEDGELPLAPFKAYETFVKGVISLDRPLERLSPQPRDAKAPLKLGSGPLIPAPPAKQPPPTVVEELELETSRIVGKLAAEFARMCYEEGAAAEEQEQQEEEEGKEGAAALLGHKGIEPHQFFRWLQEQEEGGAYRQLSAELRPAIVRMVRSEAKDGPSCGLSGNEKDAQYSGIRNLILGHLFKALNHDVDLHKRKRDAGLWRSLALHGDANSRDPSFAKPGDLATHHREKDVTLRRLAFEYELLGQHRHAVRFFKELLSLPHNKENASAWFAYARLLMRCGQRQPEAVEALQFCASLRPPEEGPSLNEAAFLACMLQNHALPCNQGAAEPTPTVRFDAARAVLEGYADKHPGEQLPLLLLFVVYGVEAYGLQAEAAAEESESGGAEAQRGGAAIAQQAKAQMYQAQAMKYLELARLAPTVFRGSLSEPHFPELEALAQRERLARGEAPALPAEAPREPEAWAPVKQPVFSSYEDRHRLPAEEDKTALRCVELMLHFGVPGLIHFLLTIAPEAYGFLSEQTVRSERCKLMLIKAAMLSGHLDDAIAQLQELLSQAGGCLREAHVLLGECYYRKASVSAEADGLPGSAAASTFDAALAAFDDALGFLPEALTGPAGAVEKAKPDPVLHLRVASIYYMRAQASSFTDAGALARAVEHYKRSLRVVQTAEAWQNTGICAYRQACLLPNDSSGSDSNGARQQLLREALRFLSEANLLDKERPSVNGWLTTCAVELGLVQVAKQALRQVLRFEENLDFSSALELASVLLRFSDEKNAPAQSDRGPLYQDGRYAAEAAAVARIALSRSEDSPEARLVLGRALEIRGEHEAAAQELAAAAKAFGESGDERRQAEAIAAGRRCSARLVGEPKWAAMIEEVVAAGQRRPDGEPESANAGDE